MKFCNARRESLQPDVQVFVAVDTETATAPGHVVAASLKLWNAHVDVVAVVESHTAKHTINMRAAVAVCCPLQTTSTDV